MNNHDDALQFEPIHRVLFGVDHEKFMNAFRAAYPNAYEGQGSGHTIEFVWNGESHFITVPDPKVQLAVGTLQGVIDQYLQDNGGEVDYIHGDDVTRELGSKPRTSGIISRPARSSSNPANKVSRNPCFRLLKAGVLELARVVW